MTEHSRSASPKSELEPRLSFRRLVPDTIAKFFAELLVLAFLGTFALIAKYYDSPLAWTIFFGIVALVSPVLLLIVWRSSDSRETTGQPNAVSPPPLSQGYKPDRGTLIGATNPVYVGIDVGRLQISHGLLRVPGNAPRDLPVRELEVIQERRLDKIGKPMDGESMTI